MFLVYNLEGFFLLSMFVYHLIRRRTGYISVQICSVVGVFITQSSAYLPMATVYFFLSLFSSLPVKTLLPVNRPAIMSQELFGQCIHLCRYPISVMIFMFHFHHNHCIFIN